MGKPKAPKAPDYAAAAVAQGQANVNSALATNYLNQVNQVGPYGSIKYEQNPGVGLTLADGTFIPQTTLTTTLSPEQQRLYDQETAISTQLNDLAVRGIGYVDQASSTPIDLASLPPMTTSVAPAAFRSSADPGTLALQGFQGTLPNLQTRLDGTNYQDAYDFSGVSQAPRYEDFNSSRDAVTNAMMQRLQPYIDRDREALRTQLVNQGIGQGTEAYGWDMGKFQQGVNDQRVAALLAGTQEQQNLFNNAMGLRQQGVQEALAQGNLKNSVADAVFNQRAQQGNFFNQNQQQGLQNALTVQGFNNQTQQQEYDQNQQDLLNYNQAQEAMFNQGLASAQFANQAHTQALQEADYAKNAPLNMLNALRSGNQVTTPSFVNAATGAQIQAAPIYQATADSFDAAMQRYQAKLQASGGFLGGLASLGGSLGSAAIMASDRRLKTGIQAIGQRPDGLMLYSYNYVWGQPSVGVMADEVAAKRPDALGPIIHGFATVNYGAL